MIREKGTDRSKFFRGMVDKYTWVDVGSSYLMSDMLAAYLVGQLDDFDHIQARRHAIWATYAAELAAWASERGVRLPTVPPEAAHPAHLFHLLLPSPDDRKRFIKHLGGLGVHAVFHYVPLHSSPMGRRYAPDARCPVTDDVSARLVRLPLYPGLDDPALRQVVDAVLTF